MFQYLLYKTYFSLGKAEYELFKAMCWWYANVCYPSWNMMMWWAYLHYSDVIMIKMASQITSLKIVYLTVYSSTEQRKHQNLRVTGFCEGYSAVTGEFPAQRASNAEMFPIHDVIIGTYHIAGHDVWDLRIHLGLSSFYMLCSLLSHLTSGSLTQYVATHSATIQIVGQVFENNWKKKRQRIIILIETNAKQREHRQLVCVTKSLMPNQVVLKMHMLS